MAGEELRSKLQQRLERHDEVVRFCRSEETANVATDEADDLQQFQAKLNAATQERNSGCRERQSIEASAVAFGIQLGADVARLRVEVEVIRKELDSAKGEATHIRVDNHLEGRRQRVLEERAVQLGQEHSAGQARRDAMIVDLDRITNERDELVQQMKRLEEDMALHVVEKVRLEAEVRRSVAREAEMRRQFNAKKVELEWSRQPTPQETVYAVLDDDDCIGDSGAYAAGHCGNQYDDDLEFSYEGLDLSGVMSLDRAVQLAHRRVEPTKLERWENDRSQAIVAGALEEGSTGGDTMCVKDAEAVSQTSLEAQYEAPLRALELALAMIRSGGSTGGEEVADVTAGTGEAVEDTCRFEAPLTSLQESLAMLRCSTRLESIDPDGQSLPVLALPPSPPEISQDGNGVANGMPEASGGLEATKPAQYTSAISSAPRAISFGIGHLFSPYRTLSKYSLPIPD